MESSTIDLKVPVFVSYYELMFDTLKKHVDCLWEKHMHCQKQASIEPEQVSILKGIIKEEKKIVRLFNKFLELSTDKLVPCNSCILCQSQIDISEERVSIVAKNQPTESDYKKQFREFQEELAKHCRLQANACNMVNVANKNGLYDLPLESTGMDMIMGTDAMPATPTITATTMEPPNSETTTKGPQESVISMETFESIPKKEEK